MTAPRTTEWKPGPVTVAVPATSANLGPGFDSLGLALDLVDEVSAEIEEGFRVEVTGEGAGEVPTGADHLIVATMLTTFDRMGVARPPGLRLHCHNRIPHARGLGSSSAAIVAGISLARAFVARRAAGSNDAAGPPEQFPDSAALALAAELEGHPDNVAPCLLGGFTIAWTATDGARAVRLTPADSITPVVYVPVTRGLTAHARAVLPAQVPHRDAVFNTARAALLVHALTTAPDLLLAATEDRLHQPYRAPAMPETAALVARLRETGVPAFVSGAGPSVLALTSASDHPPIEPPSGWWSRSLSCSATGARML